MTISTGLFDAKTRLSEFVNKVLYGGERVVITRNGKPVAALVSPDDLARLEALEIVDETVARRVAMKRALADARVWTKHLLEQNGGEFFPPANDLLREIRDESLES